MTYIEIYEQYLTTMKQKKMTLSGMSYGCSEIVI